ncbi:hypothetical protein FA375_23175 [Pseudomonas aeruginosa]|jgi:ATP/maltotriose-dependent transcriptional regulator MalT|nr:LuxR C-terminal-related transcriptional regulator [Pseudomonas aeruginosa]MAF88591.1 hypothetical protein [Pseudomonas sp.]EKJ9725350.1 hypothetical protein [Pseudomonas aeruginosa]EKW8363619.1 hypothetical protein [Pseudomonas aeruginosa]ELQ7353072.1 hypothetical protein [Pseudomonas aeruginosa]MAK87826.1 hypothetical protein [Pseudomonas sp.]|tara:strand:+ start:58 stop:315 length:258 start_codon:yes stop_codon:yes gene_type:complete
MTINAESSLIPSGKAPAEEASVTLTKRELLVLQLVAQGMSWEEVGEQLFVSINTAKTHAKRIHAKLGVKRRTHAVAKAKQLGLLK